ncbi:MAG: hypothetical protein ACKO37_07480 [Vampirovibrionales bacterium]
MMTHIGSQRFGNTGYPHTLPGAFGRQAGRAFIKMQDTDPLRAVQTPITYSPTGYQTQAQTLQSTMNNLGFNDAVIQRFDTNKDGVWDFGEVRAAFGLNPKGPNPQVPADKLGEATARRWMQVSDATGDGKIDLGEQAATTLVQDSPGFWVGHAILRRLPDLAKSPDLFPPEALQRLQGMATSLLQQAEFPDGKLSPEDRRLMDTVVDYIPNFGAEAVKLAHQQLNLGAWGQAYRDMQARKPQQEG